MSSRRRAFERPDMLLVQGEGGALYLAIDSDGAVTAFNGHVDLGTGIRTALTQIVADELDVPVSRVTMVLGDTDLAPNQGATIASESIQVSAKPLRQAAASARRHFLTLASDLLGLPPEELGIEDGVISPREAAPTDRRVSFGDLVRGREDRLRLDPAAPLKARRDYRIVGHSTPRTDIASKAAGTWTYVHDVRVPGMAHGRVVRPPYAGLDSGAQIGASLIAADNASIAHIPGLVALVVIADFIGVVTEREEDAIEAARALKVTWRDAPAHTSLDHPEAALRANPSRPRRLLDRGDVDRAAAAAETPMSRTYVWPYQMHGSIGPSCAVADYRDGAVTVWSGTQNPFPLRSDLARLLAVPDETITVHRLEAAGCYGRNCADDVSADAALLSRAARRPVRVQLTREQEHAWEPKGAAQVMDVRGGLDREGGPAAYDFSTCFPSNGAPTLALLLTGSILPVPDIFEMGDRTAIPPYAFGNARVTVHDMAPIVRASWFRGVSALPNSFAHESYIDELAFAAGVDPVAYRLRYLTDPRGAALVRGVTERAKWTPRTVPGTAGREGDVAYGRGFAYALYTHGTFPGTAAAWAAWVCDVAVNTKTGEVAVLRITAGQDAGLMINPGGVRHQIHGNVVQSASRVLKEAVTFEHGLVASREWGSYPIITFEDVPQIDVLMLEPPDQPPLGAGESASLPSAAAIANAVFDATGVRFRELPLTPDRILAGLNGLPPPQPAAAPARQTPKRRWHWPVLATGVGAFVSALGLAAGGVPVRSAIAPISRPDAGVYSAATLERGRLAAALGACDVCHRGAGGAFSGGRGLETPFGTVFAANVTPDARAGIGAWSYPAFERAMRKGISRDGHALYPAHPYPSYAGANEADIESLYAYLMTQPAVATPVPATVLGFPFNVRPLMAIWNLLFLRTEAIAADPGRSEEWNRGAYLVESLGHCSACHSPRNRLGAERKGADHLAGGEADGWHAPALNALSLAPIPWSEAEFYDYLRHGQAHHHGSAAGPMAEVVASLQPVPDTDIRAMAVYLASLAPAALSPAEASTRATSLARLGEDGRERQSAAGRMFLGACGACHTGDSISLALATSLHAEHPGNVIRAILDGVKAPPAGLRDMPAFGAAFSDTQIAELARFLRFRFAPDKAPWGDLEETVARLRDTNSQANRP